MRKGSKPCRLRPVGSTAGVRSTSPPGAGRTKRPSRALRMPAISWSSASRPSVAASSRSMASVGSPAIGPARVSAISGVAPSTRAAIAARSGRAPCAASAIDKQEVDALLGAGRLADHVQAVRDQGVFELEDRPRPAARRGPRRRGPKPAPPSRDRALSPGAWIRAARAARSETSASGVRPRQRSIEALRSSRPR